MAVPGGRRSALVRFVLRVCAGITGFVVIALFTAHGQAQVFAEGAVAVGVGSALAAWLL